MIIELDTNLKALCLDIITENTGSVHFTQLLCTTKVRLDSIEWDIANKMLEKGDEMKHALGRHQFSIN